jgi:MFS family permease
MPDPQRDFYKLWAGQTISEIGSRITREGLPLTAVFVLNANAAQMGILAAFGSASVLLFGVAAGVIADRKRRRPLMIGADLGRAALLATVPLAALYGKTSFPQLIAVAVLTGILTVQFDVAYQSYLPALVPREDLFEGNRRLGMSAAVAEIAGPTLTGILIRLITAPMAILVDSISFLFSAVSVWAIRTPEPAPVPTQHESLWHEASEGARAIAHHPVLRALALRSISAFLSFGTFQSLYMLYAIRVLQLGTPTLGILISLGGAGSLLGAYFSDRVTQKFGVGNTLIGSALLSGFANLLVPLAAHDLHYAVLCMAAAQLIGDAGFTIYFINETTVRQQAVRDELLGRVNAAMQLASRGILPLGALLGGFIGERFGIPGALWIASIGVLASALWLLPLRVR